MRTFGTGFLPGPVDVHPDVMAATQEPMYFAFSDRMKALLAAAQPGLQRLFGTHRPVLISTTAGTGLMEAAIRSGVRRRVLVVCGGYFGEMFARIAEGCGKEVIRLSVPPGETLEPDQLEQFLEGPEVDAVALVHSETSTGALAPITELAQVIRKRDDVMVLVDGVSSVGAVPVETDAWGLDFVFTGSQKAMALPPGLAFGVASERMERRAETLRDRGWYLSVTHLLGATRKNLPLTTPALPVLHAMARQLERIDQEGGLAARFARHAAMADRMAEWAESNPRFPVLARPGRRSPAVTALETPGRRPADLVAELERRGWLIATGLPPLGDRIIRIGHMGDLELSHLEALLAQMERLD